MLHVQCYLDSARLDARNLTGLGRPLPYHLHVILQHRLRLPTGPGLAHHCPLGDISSQGRTCLGERQEAPRRNVEADRVNQADEY